MSDIHNENLTPNHDGSVDYSADNTSKLQPIHTGSGLLYTEVVVGAGQEAHHGHTVTVHYTGALTNEEIFDSSHFRDEPFSFDLGKGTVIAGWDEGVSGMRVGGKRRLVIPPELGYGAIDLGVIPPNSILIFDVELLDIQ